MNGANIEISSSSSSGEESDREEVKSDGLPLISFSSVMGEEYMSTQLITHGIQHSVDVELVTLTMEDINEEMSLLFEECSEMPQDQLYIDPRGVLKHERAQG